MYHGCDVWLNTPRRPMEACGTSGMKAALNGVLNCSILDGWWDEMTDGTNGFDIPSFDDDDDLARRDHREANATFDVIENQIVPLFYDRDDDGVPHRWIERVANNWATLGWNVTASRMVRDYVTALYEPAAAVGPTRAPPTAAPARASSPTGRRASPTAWPSVHVGSSTDVDEPGGADAPVRRATIVAERRRRRPRPGRADRAGASTVRCSPTGRSTRPTSPSSRCNAATGARGRGSIAPHGAGPWGVTVRAMPTHPGLSSMYDTGLVASG